MQMCPDCGKIYDESEYAHCPFCSGECIESEDEEWEEFEDPGYDYVYDEDGSCVSCPCCGAPELRHNGITCICIECESTFSD